MSKRLQPLGGRLPAYTSKRGHAYKLRSRSWTLRTATLLLTDLSWLDFQFEMIRPCKEDSNERSNIIGGHRVLREGLKFLLANTARMTSVRRSCEHSRGDSPDTELRPEIVLLGISMPGMSGQLRDCQEGLNNRTGHGDLKCASSSTGQGRDRQSALGGRPRRSSSQNCLPDVLYELFRSGA
jgi:hypothetical protein